jgi:hypothetical protein
MVFRPERSLSIVERWHVPVAAAVGEEEIHAPEPCVVGVQEDAPDAAIALAFRRREPGVEQLPFISATPCAINRTATVRWRARAHSNTARARLSIASFTISAVCRSARCGMQSIRNRAIQSH